MKFYRSTLAVALFFSALSTDVRGDFSGPYSVPTQAYNLSQTPPVFAVGTWTMTLSGSPAFYGNSMTFVSPGQVRLDPGSSAAHVFSSFLATLTNTIAADGMLSFDYSLHLSAPQFPFENYGGYTLNGAMIHLEPGVGSVAIPVSAGDAFGFFAFSGSNCILCDPTPYIGAANITITNFSAPVPEPTVLCLLVFGLAAFVLRKRLQTGRTASIE